MNKIITVILETCDPSYLTEIMMDYTKRFEDVLKRPFSEVRREEDPVKFYQLVKEK